MVKIRKHAAAGAMKSIDRAAIVIQIRVGAVKAATATHGAYQSVHALVIGTGASPVAIVIRTAGRVRQRSKIIVE
jgi:hypothetical protein